MFKQLGIIAMSALALTVLTETTSTAQNDSSDPTLVAQADSKGQKKGDGNSTAPAKTNKTANASRGYLPIGPYIAVGLATAIILVVLCTPSKKL